MYYFVSCQATLNYSHVVLLFVIGLYLLLVCFVFSHEINFHIGYGCRHDCCKENDDKQNGSSQNGDE